LQRQIDSTIICIESAAVSSEKKRQRRASVETMLTGGAERQRHRGGEGKWAGAAAGTGPLLGWLALPARGRKPRPLGHAPAAFFQFEKIFQFPFLIFFSNFCFKNPKLPKQFF
jgi:hypothetical protein